MICVPPNKINSLKWTVLTEKVIRKKSNFIIKKHNVAAKESGMKVKLNEAELTELSV